MIYKKNEEIEKIIEQKEKTYKSDIEKSESSIKEKATKIINIDNIKIDIEYDGLYWHSDKQKDRRRDNFVKSKGYKILRVLGNKKDEMPTEKCLLESVEALLNGRNYIEIVM